MEYKFPEKILFIGTYAGKEYLSTLYQRAYYVQMAANQTEEYYITELAKYVEQLDVISALVTVPYPHGKKFYINRNREVYENCKIENVDFFNLPIISVITQTVTMKKAVKRWIKKNKSKEHSLIVIYAMRIPFLKCAKILKKYLPNAVILNVVPDLPMYMRMYDKSMAGRIITRLNQKITTKLQKSIDGFILYSEKMKEELKCQNHRWIVVEGLFDQKKNRNVDADLKAGQKSIVLYAGSLEEQYGLSLLVKGFIQAKLPNTELHLYGSGSYVRRLLEYAQKYPNIQYHGMVSPEEVRKKMYQAALLVNPRPSGEDFIQFSCPSKTLEYMSTGRPVMMTKLGGVPDEYFQYIYVVEDETPEGFATELIRFFHTPESIREQTAKEGQQFIYEKKDVSVQIKRVLEFSRSLKKVQDNKC